MMVFEGRHLTGTIIGHLHWIRMARAVRTAHAVLLPYITVEWSGNQSSPST